MPVPAVWAATRVARKVAKKPTYRRLALFGGGTVFASIVGGVVGLAMLVAGTAGSACQQWANQSGGSFDARGKHDIPAEYAILYQRAGEEYSLGAEYLAAVGSVESDHGRLKAPGVKSGTNSKGAAGPMQFTAPTWADFGLDANGDGERNQYDPEDAIMSAAYKLSQQGAPRDWDSALHAYNPSWEYVAEVKERAKGYRSGGGNPEALPVTGEKLGKPSTKPIPNGVQANAQRAARALRKLGFDGSIVGLEAPGVEESDETANHDAGLALDFIVGSGAEREQTGKAIKDYLIKERVGAGVVRVIWKLDEYNSDGGFAPKKRAPRTANLTTDEAAYERENYFNRVHVEFLPGDTGQETGAPGSRDACALQDYDVANWSYDGPPPTREGWVMPTVGYFTSYFGMRWGKSHAGVDIGAPEGTMITAAQRGVVQATKPTDASGGYGNLTIIDHGGGITTAYAHQSAFLVNPGKRVAAGDPIGKVGSTGRSTGNHLHFEVRINGKPTNPVPYLPASVPAAV